MEILIIHLFCPFFPIHIMPILYRLFFHCLISDFFKYFLFIHQARRQLQAAGCLSEGESVASLGIGPPMMLGGPSGMIGDRGSCSADSGVRGTKKIDGELLPQHGSDGSDRTAPPVLFLNHNKCCFDMPVTLWKLNLEYCFVFISLSRV